MVEGIHSLTLAPPSPELEVVISPLTITGNSPAVPFTARGSILASPYNQWSEQAEMKVEVQVGEDTPFTLAPPVGPGMQDKENDRVFFFWHYQGSVTTPGVLKITVRATGRSERGDSVSAINAVTVNVTIHDVTPPNLDITQPQDGATVTGLGASVQVHGTGTALDALSGVDRVEWSLDGAPTYTLATPRAAGDWSTWSTDVLIAITSTPTAHTITIRCFDKAGNVTVKSRTQFVAPLSLTYLGDLLDFTVRRVRKVTDQNGNPLNPPQPLTRHDLEVAFCQPFDALAKDANGLANQPVRQIRLCIEVLRTYLEQTLQQAPTQSQKDAEKAYRLATYQTLLTNIGTSYEELRLIRYANDRRRQMLAARLGFDRDPAWPDHLDELLLDPAAESPALKAHTEQRLEQLFGFRKTDRAQHNAQDEGQPPALQNWRQTHLRMLWKQQDDIPDPDTGVVLPIIDPDLTRREALNTPTPGNAAFDLWQERAAWVTSALSGLQADWLPNETLRDRFDRLVTSKVALIADLVALEEKRQQGYDVEPDLKGKQLTLPAFSYLMRMRAVASPGPVLDAEWSDVYAILVQVQKLRDYANWRQQEREKALILGPDDFQVPPTNDTAPLPAWRATHQARQAWQQTLQARIDQQHAVAQALQATADATEEVTLPVLRDALVTAIDAGRTVLDLPTQLTKRLLIDVNTSSYQKTTRINQAVETLQGILFAVRTGRLREIGSQLGSNPADGWELDTSEAYQAQDFDTEWRWMGTHATWHAAMLTFFHPENLLLPTLRPAEETTSYFTTLVNEARAKSWLTPQDARDLAQAYLDALRTPKLIAHWQFDEGSGTEASDASGHNNKARLQGATWVPGKIGQWALHFDSDDAVLVANSPVLEVGKNGTDFSVAFWISLREGFTGQLRSIMHKGDEPQRTFALWMHPYSNRIHYRISTTTFWNEGGDSVTEIALNAWTHIAYVKSGNRLKLYINGLLNSEVELNGTVISNDGPLRFGIGINADLDDIRIYSHALSAGAVASLCIRGYPLPEDLEKPFALTDQLSEDELNRRRALCITLLDPFVDKTQSPERLKPETPDYLKEIFYFVPMHLALELQKAGQYVAALDWFQTVYAYNVRDLPDTAIDERKIYYGLTLEKSFDSDYQRNDDTWLLKSLNPHDIAADIAAPRANAYTRFTLLSLVRCFLEFADAEFTRDTSESVPRARALYMAARHVLGLPEMQPPSANAGAANPFATNPVVQALRMHVELQLFKLRDGRNIAGMRRQLASSTSQTTVLRPTPYRYSVLIDRTKQLVALAQQIEAAYLGALEKRDAEAYTLLQAGQHLSLAEAGVTLQNLRITDAEQGVELARRQQHRAEIQMEYFQELLHPEGSGPLEVIGLKGVSVSEALGFLAATVGVVAGVAATIATGGAALAAIASAVAAQEITKKVANTRRFVETAGMTSSVASGAGTLLEQYSSFQRRAEGWQHELDLAQQDVLIGSQQIQLAQDHVMVASQERNIAGMQFNHAKDTVNFLANKFTNIALYDEMIGILGGVYSYFLQQATAMARLVEHQLGFERQETPPAYIQADYWHLPSEPSSGDTTDSNTTDLRGLTGSARLLQDIYQLDQYAFNTNKRKLNLSQTFSLARLAPIEFQQFRDTGVLPFTTPMELFDRAFPGHYLRLIKRVRTSVVALIPPTQGIRATLSASGISRAVIGGAGFQEVVVRRDPELVALTSPMGATGVFEMDLQADMLLPFEAMGVATSWELQMPKATNPFDYRTIADVLITIEYTALNSFEYRQQVILKLAPTVSADRPFSFRQQFVDVWYDLHNPDQAATPMTVRFRTVREDFPPNIDHLKIQDLTLYFARKEGTLFEVLVTSLRFTPPGGGEINGGGATSIDGVISTRRGNAGDWASIANNIHAPIGEWVLSFKSDNPSDPVQDKHIQDYFKNEEIEEILFVITYSGRTPAWPL